MVKSPWLLALLLGAAGPVHAESTDVLSHPRDNYDPGVSQVTEETEVMDRMGLKMIPTNDLGDSREWWERRTEGWKRFEQAKKKFPPAKSESLEMYLNALAESFNRAMPHPPHVRFHFYVADTLNPSLWPAGGGFFIVHAGLIRKVKDERQFAFLLALELAHETLGHNMTPGLLFGKNWEPGRWGKNDFDAWSVEHWTVLVGNDPIERGGFVYTLQQESDALELVYRFFQANSWEFDGINRLVVDMLPGLNAIPGTSSLARLHSNLAQAIKLPHRRQKVSPAPADSVVNRGSYVQAQSELASSTLQFYDWMLELVPYRKFISERLVNLEQIRLRHNEHGEIGTTKLREVLKRPRDRTFASEAAEFDRINRELSSRASLLEARLARFYLKGAVLMMHRRWKEALVNAEQALKLAPDAEPFLWQRVSARQQLGQFNKCVTENQSRWRYYDHRRELMGLQCTFLEGRYTDAAKLAIEYRTRYPFDVEGAFWETLLQIKLRRIKNARIEEIESFWGDRPIVRALKILYYGHLEQPDHAQKEMFFDSELSYLPQEWGMLEFAQAWYRRTYSVIERDDRAEQLQALAEVQWPLARLVKLNLPREILQRRN